MPDNHLQFFFRHHAQPFLTSFSSTLTNSPGPAPTNFFRFQRHYLFFFGFALIILFLSRVHNSFSAPHPQFSLGSASTIIFRLHAHNYFSVARSQFSLDSALTILFLSRDHNSFSTPLPQFSFSLGPRRQFFRKQFFATPRPHKQFFLTSLSSHKQLFADPRQQSLRLHTNATQCKPIQTNATQCKPIQCIIQHNENKLKNTKTNAKQIQNKKKK